MKENWAAFSREMKNGFGQGHSRGSSKQAIEDLDKIESQKELQKIKKKKNKTLRQTQALEKFRQRQLFFQTKSDVFNQEISISLKNYKLIKKNIGKLNPPTLNYYYGITILQPTDFPNIMAILEQSIRKFNYILIHGKNVGVIRYLKGELYPKAQIILIPKQPLKPIGSIIDSKNIKLTPFETESQGDQK